LAWNQVSGRVGEAIDQGLLHEINGHLYHSETGWRFVNDIQAMFLP
jgi:hypothetical protein